MICSREFLLKWRSWYLTVSPIENSLIELTDHPQGNKSHLIIHANWLWSTENTNKRGRLKTEFLSELEWNEVAVENLPSRLTTSENKENRKLHKQHTSQVTYLNDIRREIFIQLAINDQQRATQNTHSLCLLAHAHDTEFLGELIRWNSGIAWRVNIFKNYYNFMFSFHSLVYMCHKIK